MRQVEDKRRKNRRRGPGSVFKSRAGLLEYRELIDRCGYSMAVDLFFLRTGTEKLAKK